MRSKFLPAFFFFIFWLVALLGIFSSTVFGQQNNLVANRRAELEKELAELEKEINAQQAILESKQRERVSLERDVAILNAKIEKAKLSIRARDIEIQKLNSEIRARESNINQLEAKILREKASLAQLIRKTNEIDAYSLPEIVFSNRNISEFFADLDYFDSIKLAMYNSFRELEGVKKDNQNQKEMLEAKVADEVALRRIQELERKRIEEQEIEKKEILRITKGVEANYQKVLEEKKKSAAEIRAELFSLRGSAAIPFEKAYELAVKAGQKTGVRPAFILGIIAEESNLGENVGTGNWRVDMKSPRDTVPFLDITKRLGLNPDLMPVSKKPWYGYGGAMGPAQFIPSTWILYEDRIAAATGHYPPNPWDPEDAFMAAAILLADNGAAQGGYANERLAALRYLAGWSNATKPAYAFYGDDVMALTEKYQNLINILQAN
jgi:peptidoglycan hydrolase CwlO-like protein